MITLACSTLLGIDGPASSSTLAPAIKNIPTLETVNSCPQTTNQILKVATSPSGSMDGKPLNNEISLVTYNVFGDNITNAVFKKVSSNLKHEQADIATQHQVWNYFISLIPFDQRKIVSQYSIFTDGEGGTLAAVTQTQNDPARWALEVDIADISDIYDFTYTLVHEFGHLLTLGPSQVPPSLAVFNNPNDDNIYLQAESACPQYFPGEGCSNSDSYINAFYDQFWVKIYREWNKINLEPNEDVYNNKLDRFYAKYQDQFVTDYAVTNPEEDIAESWAFFVFGSIPDGGTVADQKILFFYEYPELVQLRARILNNLCKAFPMNR